MTNAEESTDAAGLTSSPAVPDAPQNASPEDKGKGKGKVVKSADAMDEDEDEDDEEEGEGEDEDDVEEDDEMEDEDEYQEIDASAILPQGRRTRGVKVDYTSAEALKKAGLDNGELDADEEDEFKDSAAS